MIYLPDMSRRSEKQKLYCQMANKELKSNLNLFGKLKSNSLAIKYPLETTTVGKIVCSSDASVVMLFVPLVFKRSVFVLSLYPPTCFSSEKASYLESHCYFFAFGHGVSLLEVTLFGRSYFIIWYVKVENP